MNWLQFFTLSDVDHNQDWEPDTKIRVLGFEIGLGWKVLAKKRFLPIAH